MQYPSVEQFLENDPDARNRFTALVEKGRPELSANLLAALSDCSDPATALIGLERFLDANDNPAPDLDLMALEPRYAGLLCTIFDQSHFLTDIVCRYPEHARWLWHEGALDQARTRDEMIALLRAWCAPCASLKEFELAMRRFKQREILRIAVRDIFLRASLMSITEDLSNLADAALELSLERAYPELLRRYGMPGIAARSQVELGNEGGQGVAYPRGEEPCPPFVVIAMGKLGAGELNFSSDIDLLFLYAEEGETSGGTSGTLDNLDFFHKLGEQIIKLISEDTPEGNVFRVDMRLRPYGRTSPLAVSMNRALEYYSGFAQAWERQALIKARPAAGDLALGQDFVERTRGMVFPRYFDDDTLDEIRHIKRQMESMIADRHETEIEVKLGRGGIRDIEFTVQILQMLNGGQMPDLRAIRTLDAIKALGAHAHLKVFEATALASNYVFMRQVEHRLQIEGSQQRHVLPPPGPKLDQLARRLGYTSGDSFMTEYHDRAEETRTILQRFLTTEGAGTLWTYDLLSPHMDGNSGMARLAQFGFKDPARARSELLLLSGGPEKQPFPFHIRQQFAAIVPTLLESISQTGDPDGTLVRLARVLSNLRAPASIYDMLKSNLEFCRYLVALMANSAWLSEVLIRDPGLFEVFESGGSLDIVPTREMVESQLASLRRAYERDAAPYRLRDGELLRIGMRELFRNISVVEVGRELTQLAEVCIVDAMEQARNDVEKRYARAHGSFTILALGKLGGGEMGYGSDLDLIFVYEAGASIDSGMAPSEYYAAVAARTIHRLKEGTRYGTLYDVDARLRPDGKKGVLAVSSRRIEEYYLQEAQQWERLALMKVRVVAGDAEFGREIERQCQDIAFSLPLTTETLAAIDDIRAKIVYGASPLDLKKDDGGLIEIEFAVRLLQLRHVANCPQLKRADVIGALEILNEEKLIPLWDYEALFNAYVLFRRIENRIRMMHGRSEHKLPEDETLRQELARRLNLEPDLLELEQRHKQAVHRIYGEIIRGANAV